MKLMTLNTHSLEEEDYEAKLHAFAEGVCRAEPACASRWTVPAIC